MEQTSFHEEASNRFGKLFFGFDSKFINSKKKSARLKLEYFIISEKDNGGISPHIVIEFNKMHIYLKYPFKELIYSGAILSDSCIMDIINKNFSNLDELITLRDLKRLNLKINELNKKELSADEVIELEELRFNAQELKRLMKMYKKFRR